MKKLLLLLMVSINTLHSINIEKMNQQLVLTVGENPLALVAYNAELQCAYPVCGFEKYKLFGLQPQFWVKLSEHFIVPYNKEMHGTLKLINLDSVLSRRSQDVFCICKINIALLNQDTKLQEPPASITLGEYNITDISIQLYTKKYHCHYDKVVTFYSMAGMKHLIITGLITSIGIGYYLTQKLMSSIT
jgi:hypothetical protein